MGFFYKEEKKSKRSAGGGKKKSGGASKVRVAKEAPKYPEIEEKIKIITEVQPAFKVIQSFIEKGKAFAFDYEATGIKLYREGHEITCIALCSSLKKAYVFPIFYDDSAFMKLLKNLLKGEIKKIAHNIKYEAISTETVFKVPLGNIYWDTMIGAHILNNQGKCGLKEQIESRYEVKDYEVGVSPYLKAPGKKPSIHDFNRIKEADLQEVLLYCGMDALFTYRLYRDQKKEMDPFIKTGFDFFMEGVRAFCEIEQNGVCIDEKYYLEEDKLLEEGLEKLEKEIMAFPEVEKWPKEKFNFNSSQQLGTLLFDILKWKSVKETPAGKPSTDEESLAKLNKPFTNKILEYKKLFKMKNTYLASFLRDSFDGKLFPSFNLHIAKTFRSSSSNPNFQNIPNRNKVANKMIRGGIFPSPGNQLAEIDYSGIEVSISACYHKDPNMINYIKDKSTDMHLDMARQILCNDSLEKKSEERYLAKNNFVFPQFYGDYYVNCARNFWAKISSETKDHLKSVGITSYKKFENHMKKVENDFWGNRFKIYNKWKLRNYNRYEKIGGIDLLTGFRCTGQMNRKDVMNYPIQGSAFHCLLWSLIQIHKFIKENNLKSKIVGQIHDSIILDLVPEEKSLLLPEVKDIMCNKVREYWDWIIIPLEIEMEITPVDSPWSEKEVEEI